MRLTLHTGSRHASHWRLPIAAIIVLLLILPLSPMAAVASESPWPLEQPALDATTTLFATGFDGSADGFTYQDDTFLSTTQLGYASGVYISTGAYSGGGLKVTLGGVNANAIIGMSGGWRYALNLASPQTGVSLAFRYRVEQTATYEFDEYSRFMVSVDGVLYGRGLKNCVDHIGGDGSSTQGNSNTYLPTTDWQQYQIYVGNLSAGNHTIILGGYNNKKDATDESTTVLIDDVALTAGNAAPTTTDALTLANRVDINQFLNFNRGIAQFHDRCRGSGMGCSSTDYTTNYMNALAWVEGQLQGMGYTTFRHSFNYSGNIGTNLCGTRLGAVTPTQMYIVSGHLDGRGGGDAFNDDGSAVALGLEAARVLAGSDVTTEKSVRFCFWDKEEVGLYGARGYVQDRYSLQGTTNEPTWLGIIQHDMILYDHGAGTRTTQQSQYADLDVEWRAGTTKEADSRALALKWAYANGSYAPDYPATAYNYSTNTDDTAFHNYAPSISVRENRRSLTSGSNAEWINPYYHQTTDVESSYTRDDDGDGKRDDVELGYNAVRTTLGLVAELAGAHIVSAANHAPVANPQTVTTAEDTVKVITLTGSDADGDALTYSVVNAPAHGALSGAAPNLTYTPAANYNGADSFTFIVNDGATNSAAATVSLTVTAVNDAPVANPQSVTTPEDIAKAITLTGSDVEGSALTYSIASAPAHGALSGAAPNLTYTPAANYNGADSFTFIVNDGATNSAAATVSITVSAVNDAPAANAQSVTTAEDAAKAITLTGTDVEGSALTYSVVTAPAHGALSGAAPNLTYTPAANYNGADNFTFTVNDGALSSVAATVSITVSAVNDAPTANAQSISGVEDTPANITLTGADVDGNPLSFSVVAAPSHGTLSGAGANLIYLPAPDYNGPDSFTFKANDGLLDSAAALVSIEIGAVNDAPVADAQSVSSSENTPVAVTLSGTDADGDALTYNVVSGPANGALSGTAPDLIYTPSPGFNGVDPLSFTVSDGFIESAAATVSITVIAQTDPPTANAQAVATDEDTAVTITLTATDPNGDPLTYSVIAAPAHGVLSGGAPNLTYTPDANYNGPDSFNFVVNDGIVDSTPADVSITVNPVNDAPLAEGQAVTGAEDTPTAITLNGSDVDGDALSYAVTGAPAHGSLSGAAPNLVYTPVANYNGPDSFTFAVSDGQAQAAATVSIGVMPVNDPPTANAQAVTTEEDTAVAIILTGSDLDGDALAFSVTAAPAHGALSGTAPNLVYTPAANYNGADSFTFQVSDGTANATATISITVNPVNDAPVTNAQAVTTNQDTAVGVTLSGSDPDGDALTFTVASGPAHGALSGAAPNLTYTPAAGYSGADSFTFVTGDGLTESAPATVSITVTPVSTGPQLYIGSSTSGTAGGVSFADEDILIKNMTTGAWAMYFDGSDVGLSGTDVDAFEMLSDGSLLFSFDSDFTLSGFGAVDDSDILRFTPTSTGSTTAGAWAMYFDGSDVGLSGSSEDVDAFGFAPDGRLLISTVDAVSVTGASGADEDLLAFSPTQLGSTTSGTWSLYFDGSDVGLSSSSNEDVNGVWIDAAGKIYLTTLGAFGVTGVSGDGSDVFVCTPSSLGSTTRCTFAMYWDGSANGFSGEVTDSVSMIQ